MPSIWTRAQASSPSRQARSSGSGGVSAATRSTRSESSSALLPMWRDSADGPTGPRRLPLFVVTHRIPDDVPTDSVYTFVTGGPEAALEQARIAAREGDVAVMGGHNLGNQYLAKGLLDEIGVHIVPVLFGSGTPMFPDLNGAHVELEVVRSFPLHRRPTCAIAFDNRVTVAVSQGATIVVRASYRATGVVRSVLMGFGESADFRCDVVRWGESRIVPLLILS